MVCKRTTARERGTPPSLAARRERSVKSVDTMSVHQVGRSSRRARTGRTRRRLGFASSRRGLVLFLLYLSPHAALSCAWPSWEGGCERVACVPGQPSCTTPIGRMSSLPEPSSGASAAIMGCRGCRLPSLAPCSASVARGGGVGVGACKPVGRGSQFWATLLGGLFSTAFECDEREGRERREADRRFFRGGLSEISCLERQTARASRRRRPRHGDCWSASCDCKWKTTL